ncbi:MAG: hypothetical protein KAR54_03145 [Candidatus Pacebacteria bacterium]|nr:hypothetical protein [Candidatus Paceibacterota bacterium]
MMKLKFKKKIQVSEIEPSTKGTFTPSDPPLENKNKLEKEEDYDFDFSIYEQEEDEEKETETFLKRKESRVTLYKSKFSQGQAELEQLAELALLMKKYGIKVEERGQNIKDLWKFYGVLSEYWASISHIFGTMTKDEIDECQKAAYDTLKKYKIGRIDYNMHDRLLKFRKYIYKARNYANLTLELERRYGGQYSKAAAQIKQ